MYRILSEKAVLHIGDLFRVHTFAQRSVRFGKIRSSADEKGASARSRPKVSRLRTGRLPCMALPNRLPKSACRIVQAGVFLIEKNCPQNAEQFFGLLFQISVFSSPMRSARTFSRTTRTSVSRTFCRSGSHRAPDRPEYIAARRRDRALEPEREHRREHRGIASRAEKDQMSVLLRGFDRFHRAFGRGPASAFRQCRERSVSVSYVPSVTCSDAARHIRPQAAALRLRRAVRR